MIRKFSFLFLLLGLSFSFACSGQTESKSPEEKEAPKPAVRPTGEAPAIPENIKIAEFAEMIESNPSLVILDVRTPEEVAAGYVEGAVKINVFDADFEQQVAKLDKKAPIAVYCKMGGRSSKAQGKMLKMGFEKVYNVAGGYTSWVAAGHPTVKD